MSNGHICRITLRGDAFAELIASKATLERLGLMRNYEIHPHDAAQLYDLSKDLGITIEERAQLVEALLDNKLFLEHTQYWEYFSTENKDIWEHAIKWPEAYQD